MVWQIEIALLGSPLKSIQMQFKITSFGEGINKL